MSSTTIQWTDSVWNPIRGCSRVSAGCGGPNGQGGCYAESIAARFSGPGQPYHGLATMSPARWTGEVRLVPEKLGEPLTWRKPRRVFVNSMSDLFHEKLTNEEIAAVFCVMAACPRHTFQVLTKRPERMWEWFRWVERDRGMSVSRFVQSCGHGLAPEITALRWPPDAHPDWPIPNVWLGTSVEDQRTADERIPLLLQCPASIHFVSYEPAIGPVSFLAWIPERCPCDPCRMTSVRCTVSRSPIDWVIVGGESGPWARPCDVEWIRDIVRQCRGAGVACFVKQLGANPVDAGMTTYPDGVYPTVLPPPVLIRDPKGGDPSEWPEDLRVREFPEVWR